MSTPSNDKILSWPCSVGLWPGAPTDPHMLPGGIGPRVVPVVFDFTAAGSNGTPIAYDFTLIEQNGGIGSIQGVFIDNSANAAQNVVVQFNNTQLKISIAKNTQAIMPVFEPSAPLRFSISTTGLVLVPTFWVNFPVAPVTWLAS